MLGSGCWVESVLKVEWQAGVQVESGTGETRGEDPIRLGPNPDQQS